MRVHPAVLQSKKFNWRYPLAVVLLLAVLAVEGVARRNPHKSSSTDLKVSVVVTQLSLQAGTLLDETNVRLEKFPANKLSGEVIKDLDQVLGQYVTASLPEGFPLPATLVSNAAPEGEDQAERLQKRLAKIAQKTVAITIPFSVPPPEPGSRIALALRGNTGQSVLVADEAWIESTDDYNARIRLKPHTALFVQEATSLGTFSYVVIQEQGPSPFKGKASSDIHQLRAALDSINTQDKSPEEVIEAHQEDDELSPGDFSSYAWLTGGQYMFAINKEGRIHVIDPSGYVNPLYGKRVPMNRSKELRNKQQARTQARIENGL